MKKMVLISFLTMCGFVFGQDGEQLSPVPPGKKYVMNAVFKRFPGVDRNEVLELAKENFAAKMQEIEKLTSVRPNEAVEQMTQVVYELVELLKVKQSYPELFENRIKQMRLEKEAARYARQARLAEGSKRGEALTRLKEALARIFEVKQEVIRMDLARMESELRRLERMVKKRDENKDLIIERRIRQLLGETAQVEW